MLMIAVEEKPNKGQFADNEDHFATPQKAA